MTKFTNVLLLSFGLMLGGNAAAQGNHITIGVKPGQTTTGTSSNGGAGGIGVTIGGYGTIPVNVPPGTDSAGIAAATTAALQANGFTATQNGTDVTVTSGPGGAPLKHGGGIGSTDTGVTGVKSSVHKVPNPPAPPMGGQAGKQNGGNVPKANPQKQAQGPGSIQVDVEVSRFVNGQWTLMWIQVVVQVLPGDSGDTINSRIRQQMLQQGLFVKDITLPPCVAPITPCPSFSMDRTDDGGKVQGVAIEWTGGALDVVDFFGAGAGLVPIAGVTEYDRAVSWDGVENPFFLVHEGEHGVGQQGGLHAILPPNQIGLWLFAPGSGGPWIQAPEVPLPIVGPGFYLPMDPFLLDIHVGLTDPLGQMQMALPIPPNPNLAGFELHTAAMVLDPLAPSLFENSHRTNPLSIRIGD